MDKHRKVRLQRHRFCRTLSRIFRADLKLVGKNNNCSRIFRMTSPYASLTHLLATPVHPLSRSHLHDNQLMQLVCRQPAAETADHCQFPHLSPYKVNADLLTSPKPCNKVKPLRASSKFTNC